MLNMQQFLECNKIYFYETFKEFNKEIRSASDCVSRSE